MEHPTFTYDGNGDDEWHNATHRFVRAGKTTRVVSFVLDDISEDKGVIKKYWFDNPLAICDVLREGNSIVDTLAHAIAACSRHRVLDESEVKVGNVLDDFKADDAEHRVADAICMIAQIGSKSLKPQSF
jgi:hypothetical protein